MLSALHSTCEGSCCIPGSANACGACQRDCPPCRSNHGCRQGFHRSLDGLSWHFFALLNGRTACDWNKALCRSSRLSWTLGKSKAWLLDGLISGSKELITNRTASHILSSAFYLNFLPSRMDSPARCCVRTSPEASDSAIFARCNSRLRCPLVCSCSFSAIVRHLELLPDMLGCLSRSEFPKLSCP